MSPVKLSRFESGTRTILNLQAAFNRHDLPAILVLLSLDCILETASPPPDGTFLKGADDISAYLQGLFETYPNLKLEIEEIFGMGFRVVMRWRMAEGKNPARGVDIFKFKGEKICEWLRYQKE